MALTDRTGLTRPSAIVLLAVNSLPLLGVLLFGWSVFDVVFFYWAENVIIGVINVARILKSSGEFISPDDPRRQGAKVERLGQVKQVGGAAKIFLAAFFTVHYGMFCFGHQQFVIGMFGDGRSAGELIADPVIGLGLLAIAGSHLFSFFKNYLGGGEYQRMSAASLMTRPYGRIIVLHITIIVGGFLVMLADSPVLLLIALIVIKTAVDLRQHDRERGLLAAAR
ncbi:MAG: DUF6498-containing protein [Woeseiaceae bacterium]|nr:DUF6498-containing protein [Woeseiaceae bacterium]